MEKENSTATAVSEDNSGFPTIPNWYIIAMVFALVWNLMGVMAFVDQMMMSAEALERLTPEQLNYFENIPMLANIAFAFAVFGGTLGCASMLIKKGLAVTFFKLSLGGVVVQMLYAVVLSNSIEVFGPSSLAMPIMVTLIAIVLLSFSLKAKRCGWIN